MKLATWNVNSLKVRLQHVLDWVVAHPVDVLCLQETKLVDERFPVAELAEAGYAAAYSGQPSYNGVAILTRLDSVGPAADVVIGNPRFEDTQRRLISATIADVRVICGYFPNGQEVGSDKYAYKLRWIDALIGWLGEDESMPCVLAGDFNIAPEDRDVHDPAMWAGKIMCSDDERARFRALTDLGLIDCFREFEQPDRQFTWWDYRMLAFRRNAGLRIDHILCDPKMRARLSACSIDRAPRKLEKPSDHAPVIVTFDSPVSADRS